MEIRTLLWRFRDLFVVTAMLVASAKFCHTALKLYRHRKVVLLNRFFKMDANPHYIPSCQLFKPSFVQHMAIAQHILTCQIEFGCIEFGNITTNKLNNNTLQMLYAIALWAKQWK